MVANEIGFDTLMTICTAEFLNSVPKRTTAHKHLLESMEKAGLTSHTAHPLLSQLCIFFEAFADFLASPSSSFPSPRILRFFPEGFDDEEAKDKP